LISEFRSGTSVLDARLAFGNQEREPIMLPQDFSEFAIELRFDPTDEWLWAVVDAEGLTLSSGCSSSQTVAWRMARGAAEAILQSRHASFITESGLTRSS
jgi:hypothetical protein